MKLRRKITASFGLALAAGLVLSGCGTTALDDAGIDDGGAANERGEVDHILVDYPFTALPVYSLMVPWIEEVAEEQGVTVEFTNDEMDLSKQVTNLTTFVSSDVDAVVSFPMDPASLESIAKDYQNAGKYWVTYGGDMENQDATLQFSFYDSGYQLGAHAAEWATENIGDDAEILLLEDMTIQIGQERTQGIIDGINETNPNLEIVAQQQAVTPDDGLSVTNTVIAQNPDIQVVVAAVGDAAQGAYQALIASGRDAQDANTYVGGLDANLYGFEQMREGTFFRALSYFSMKDFVSNIITIPVALGNGEEDASVDFPVELVTEDSPNLDEIIAELGG